MPYQQAWPVASVVGGGSPLTTGAITTTSGNTAVVLVAANNPNPGVGNVTDSKGNTYTMMTATPDGPVDGDHMQGYYSENIIGGAGHTITFTSPSGDCILLAVELSGVVAASFDQQVRASGNSTTLGSGNITTTATDDIVGFMMAENFTGDFTATGGATSRAELDDGSTLFSAMIQVEDSQAAGTNNATATYTVSGGWIALVGGFKNGAGGGGGGPLPFMMTVDAQWVR